MINNMNKKNFNKILMESNSKNHQDFVILNLTIGNLGFKKLKIHKIITHLKIFKLKKSNNKIQRLNKKNFLFSVSKNKKISKLKNKMQIIR